MNIHTNRWAGTFAGSIFLAAFGIVTASSAFFIAAVFPLIFAMYSSLSTSPSTPNIELTRSITPQHPAPGEPITVTITVTNTSETAIPDLRIIDGVPTQLTATNNSPRNGVALRSNSTTEYTYTVRSPRGTYEFTEPTVRTRSVSTAAYTTNTPAIDGDSTVTCTTTVTDAPLNTDTTPYTGTLTTQSPGEGLEFHSTRDYRRGDAISRVNWRDYAKTGSLTTIEYNEPHTAEVLLVVDAHDDTDIAGYSGGSTGRELSGYAAEQLMTAFRTDNHQVGIAVTGIGSSTTHQTGLIQPTTDSELLTRTNNLFDALAHGDSIPTDLLHNLPVEQSVTDNAEQLCKHLSANTQIIYITPGLNDTAYDTASVFKKHGHQLTILSPDITTTNTHGQTLTHIRRETRLEKLRQLGTSVIDWNPETPLELVLTETQTETTQHTPA